MTERTPENVLWLFEALHVFGAWSGLTLTFMNYDCNRKFWLGGPRWQIRKFPPTHRHTNSEVSSSICIANSNYKKERDSYF